MDHSSRHRGLAHARLRSFFSNWLAAWLQLRVRRYDDSRNDGVSLTLATDAPFQSGPLNE